jgi:hypothetical protein
VDYLAKLPARLDCSGLAHTSVNRIDFPTGEMNMLTLITESISMYTAPDTFEGALDCLRLRYEGLLMTQDVKDAIEAELREISIKFLLGTRCNSWIVVLDSWRVR